VSDQQQRRETALAGPCPYCGIPRGEHDMKTLMPHTLMAFGATEDEAESVWARVIERISK
jgi:hypothetical protein